MLNDLDGSGSQFCASAPEDVETANISTANTKYPTDDQRARRPDRTYGHQNPHSNRFYGHYIPLYQLLNCYIIGRFLFIRVNQIGANWCDKKVV
jgi:hypothetical protein